MGSRGCYCPSLAVDFVVAGSVIRMEAELLKKASSEQSQTIYDAIEDIEKLLEEVKENFMLPR